MAESTFKKNLSDVSKEIVHWKKNMFVLPSGAAERERVEKVTHLIKLFDASRTFFFNIMDTKHTIKLFIIKSSSC